jgi:hypothetical protein
VGAVGRPLPQQVDDRFGKRRFGVWIGIHVPWDLRPPTVLEGLPARRLVASGTGTVLLETRDSPRDFWEFGRFPGPPTESTRVPQTTGSSGPPGASGRCSARPATDSPSPVVREERERVPFPGTAKTLRSRSTTRSGWEGRAPGKSGAGKGQTSCPTLAQDAHVRPLAASTRGPNFPVRPPMTSQEA